MKDEESFSSSMIKTEKSIFILKECPVMEFNCTLYKLIMRIDWKGNNTNVLLINAESKIDLREFYICWSHAWNDKIFLHWRLQKLTIECKELTLESPFIFNFESHVLITVSFIHQTWDLWISALFTTFLNKKIDRGIKFVMINF